MNNARSFDTLIELLETRQLLAGTPIPIRMISFRDAVQVQSGTTIIFSGTTLAYSARVVSSDTLVLPRGISELGMVVRWDGISVVTRFQVPVSQMGFVAYFADTVTHQRDQAASSSTAANSTAQRSAPALPAAEEPAAQKAENRNLPVDVTVRPLRQADVAADTTPVQTPIRSGATSSSSWTFRPRTPISREPILVRDVDEKQPINTPVTSHTAALAAMAIPLTFRKQAAAKLAEAVRVSREGIQAMERVFVKPAPAISQPVSPVSNPSFDDAVSFGRPTPRALASLGAMPLVRTIRQQGLWLLAALIGMWLIFSGTTRGIGTFGDSVTYFTAAKSLMAGTGLMQHAADGSLMPLSQFPPAYPVTLAAGAWVTGDILSAARGINVLAFGISIFLVGMITHRLTHSTFVSGAAALFMACHGQVLGVHVRMYSEAMYVTLTLGVLASLVSHGPRGRWLVLAGVLAGIAALTRFAGVHLIACCAIWIVVLNWQYGWRATVRRSALFLVPAMGALAAWSIRNMTLSGQASSRSFAYHPPAWDQVMPIFQVMKHWVIPIEGVWQTPAMYLAILLWAIVPILAICILGVPRSGVRARLALPILFAITYLPFLLTARTFFDAAIPFNYRLLMPMFPSALIVAAVFLTRCWIWWRRRQAPIPGRAMAGLASALVALVLVRQANGTVQTVRRTADKGLGYAANEWAQSAAMQAIRALPRDTIIYTNAADAVYLLTDRPVRTIPRSYARYGNRRGNSRAQRELAALHKSLSREKAVVVYFSAIQRNALLVSEEQFRERITDVSCQQLADGRIYSIPR